MNWWAIAGLILIVIVGAILWPKSRPIPVVRNLSTPTPAIQMVPSNIPTPTVAQTSTRITKTGSGPATGSISCNYLIPAAPDRFGTARVDFTWQNFAPAVCVSINGASPSLMTQAAGTSGSSFVSASWIARNAAYEFRLMTNSCTGSIVSACQITTH